MLFTCEKGSCGDLIRVWLTSLCLHALQCSALCNDSSLYYDPDRSSSGAGSSGGGTTGPSLGGYHRIGEATEVALRVLAEKVRQHGPPLKTTPCTEKGRLH